MVDFNLDLFLSQLNSKVNLFSTWTNFKKVILDIFGVQIYVGTNQLEKYFKNINFKKVILDIFGVQICRYKPA